LNRLEEGIEGGETDLASLNLKDKGAKGYADYSLK
jgi:hypothetical protein